jgi:hypothetical protein
VPPIELTEYFAAERQGGFLLVAMALAGFGFAILLWIGRGSFVAMAWPLVILGTLQVAIGLTVALRAPGQVAALEQGLGSARAATLAAESARMRKVDASFRRFKAIEIAVVVAGLLAVLLLPTPGTWSAVGLGLALEAMALLVFDAFAHHRARVYAQWLQGMAA